ncbi:four helix bundle protein [Maribellus luteus]|uniref:Four helix bundle protein n=1 Tax=Maribellus luteus TaxID=2305463 RepID=A0A399T798_9BACT|nr:four helix bundle protein [Maribellus luteus]RIJ50057.1 four helix bundle protein [Maribellus luteus]
MNRFDLEERLIKSTAMIIRLAETLPNSPVGSHMQNQIVRSGTSPALNYGEAQSAESKKDFIHKMSICLKELRETFVALKIIKYSGLTKTVDLLEECFIENNELISIFVKSIETAKKNRSVEHND